MMTLEEKYAKVRGALVQMVGSDDRNELEQLKLLIGRMPVSPEDREVTISGINALIETNE